MQSSEVLEPGQWILQARFSALALKQVQRHSCSEFFNSPMMDNKLAKIDAIERQLTSSKNQLLCICQRQVSQSQCCWAKAVTSRRRT